jgi:hypothetical protein
MTIKTNPFPNTLYEKTFHKAHYLGCLYVIVIFIEPVALHFYILIQKNYKNRIRQFDSLFVLKFSKNMYFLDNFINNEVNFTYLLYIVIRKFNCQKKDRNSFLLNSCW